MRRDAQMPRSMSRAAALLARSRATSAASKWRRSEASASLISAMQSAGVSEGVDGEVVTRAQRPVVALQGR